MPTTRKNVRDYLKMTGCILLSLFFSVVVIGFLIPANIVDWIYEYELEFRLIALGALLFFLAYKTYRFIKRTEKPWQIFKVAGWILLSLFIAVIAIFFLVPGIVVLGTMWFIAEYESEIGWIALGVFLLFLTYKTYRFIKRTENPWQTFKGNLKKNLIIYFSFAFTIYACMALFVTLFPTEYGRCDFFNEHLNGGVKKFHDQKLKVHLCGTGGYSSMLSHEDYEIRLQVFSEQGELLATRYFSIYYGDGFSRVIEYHPDSIKYEDYADHDDDDFETTLSMPPTTLDWIRARIPLLD